MKKRYKYLLPKNQWGWIKYQQMLFYKDFDIVFGMRQSRLRHKAYLLRLQKVCQECGTNKNLTLDHIIPLKMKGADRLYNKQLLCYECNHTKAGIPYSLNTARAQELKLRSRGYEPLPLEIWPLITSMGKLIKRKWRKWRGKNVKGEKVVHPGKPKIRRKPGMRSVRDHNRAYELRQRLADGDNLS